jgi:CheY-like chemotaxis protein
MARPANVPLGFSTRSLRLPAGVSVLVVDDVHATRAGLAELLRLRGLVVHEAANGHDALDLLRTYPETSVVVLDLRMPQTDGYWFREQQLQDPAISHVPVIVFTGSPDSEPLARLQLSHVLLKPFSVDVLLEAIGRYCDTDAGTS